MIKRLIQASGWIIAVLFLVVPQAASAIEEILLFEADITPKTDGTFLVKETITYNFGDLMRHGIFRDLDTTHQQEATEWYRQRYLEIDLRSVQMDGSPVPYEVYDYQDSMQVKIGDPDVKITDRHVYTISYLVSGGLSYYDDGLVELYWNATGHDWEVPIRKAVVRVDIGNDLVLPRRFCYVGAVGSTDSCTVSATSTQVTFTTRALTPGMGLTIAQELDRKQVAQQIIESSPAWVFWVVFVLVWFIGLGWFVYRYKTAHKPVATVISQYEPYQDFKPMFTGVLIDGHLDSKDITAGLVYLAEQGFLKIKKTQDKVMLFFEVDDYEVTLLRAVDEAETNFLREVLLLLFEDYDAVGHTVKLSKLKSDTGRRRENAKKIKALKDTVMEDLEQRGFFERIVSLSTIIVLFVGGLFIIPFIAPFVIAMYQSFVFPLIVILVGSLIVLGFAYQRRTRKGYEAFNHLKGFKEFLSVTDKERFKFHNAPDKNPEQFMRFLPYAIALGVEEEWSEVFKDIQIETPNWYEGQGSFSAVALTHDIGAFSSSFTQSTTSPSSSGSGGGGFSGGGAGGGGGGSW